MPVPCAELIEASESDQFFEALAVILDTIDGPEVDPTSIRISLAVTPDHLYAATVFWLDVSEEEELADA